ncbi:hypothetical protein V6N11_037874 [Hibiscus sabdariffa]|uniref:MADS-box domain-containing protein n=1 Tax=Hibiscus sabdariffa TaxID=183260 RepID=A0ABR2A6I7_9ROSI
MASSGKKTRGKQMIDMKIIEKEDEKLITLSKRRSGIYEKLKCNPHPLGELEVQMVNGAIAAARLGGNSFLLSRYNGISSGWD